MANEKKRFDLSGFDKNPDGTYSKKSSGQPRDKGKSLMSVAVKYQNEYDDAQLKIHGAIVRANLPLKSIITIPGIVDGLNGGKGLMRGHWTQWKKLKQLYMTIIYDQMAKGVIRKHLGKVKVTYIGYKSVLMDWDNFGASFKHIGDAMVKCGVIADDKPSVVVEFLPKQEKVKRVDQRVVIIVEDVV